MWILDAIVEPIWWSRDGKGKDGAVARCRAKVGEYWKCRKSLKSGRTGQDRAGKAGRAATVEEQDKLLLGLADKVSKALKQRDREAESYCLGLR